jgi:magnesium chelatase family protein
MNPCSCGYLGHYAGRCHCTPDQVARYRGRLSGPLLDRIDIQLDVPAVPQDELMRQAGGENSEAVRGRVRAAWKLQRGRQGKLNSELTGQDIDRTCATDEDAALLLRRAIARLNLSARAYHRVLRIARTIADLAGAARIASSHVAEAIQYRRPDARGR